MREGGGRSLTSTQAVHWIVHGLGGGGREGKLTSLGRSLDPWGRSFPALPTVLR